MPSASQNVPSRSSPSDADRPRERPRLEALHSPPDESLDRVTALAAEFFDVEVAFTSLWEPDRYRIPSSAGLSRNECARVVPHFETPKDTDTPIVVEDTTDTERGSAPSLASEFGLRFFAGAPLVTSEGETIGTFFVADPEPQSIPAEKVRRLDTFADMILDELHLRQWARRRDQSAQHLENVPEAPTVFAAVLAPDGTLLGANSSFFDSVDADAEEILGHSFWNAPWWSDRMRAPVRRWAEQAARGDHHERELILTASDGTSRPVEGTIHPVLDHDAVSSLVVWARDVTTRNEAEQTLKQQETLYREILRNITDTVLIARDDGTLTYVCPNVEHIFGHDQQEAEALGTISALLGTDPAAGHDFEEDPELTNVETSITDAAGTRHDLLINVRWVSIQDGTRMYTCRDVTERKDAEREFERQNELFKETQDLAQVGGWEYDLRTGEHRWTEQVYRIYDLPTSFTPTAEAGLDYYHPVDQPVIREAFTRAVEEGESYDVEVRLITAEGRQRWVRTRGAPHITDGDVPRVRGSIQDITKRKTEERRRRQVIRRVTDAIVELDSEWRFTLINDQAETLYDMDADSLLGERFWDVFPEVLGTRFEKTYRSVMTTREPITLTEYYPQLDGWFDVQMYPNDDGGVAFYFQEVTERKERERTLARQKALLEAQAETTIDGLLVVDSDRHVAFYNDRFLDIWDIPKRVVEQTPKGKALDEVLLDSVSTLLEYPDEFRQKVEHLYEYPDEESRDLIRLSDGRRLDRYSAPIVGNDGTHFGRLWIFRDVTERHRMQERLLDVQEAERRRITQQIHDEMGGLLASLQMSVDLARTQAQGASEPFDQMERLVNELSTTVRTISRKIYPSALSDHGLAGSLPSLANEIEKHHDLSVDLQSEIEPEDRFSSLVERTAYWIVQEALLNAARHAETNTARVQVHKRERHLVLEIDDEGIGFEPSAQDGDKSFGLKGIRRRVERLRGDVEIDAALGRGTRISATVPVTPSGTQ